MPLEIFDRDLRDFAVENEDFFMAEVALAKQIGRRRTKTQMMAHLQKKGLSPKDMWHNRKGECFHRMSRAGRLRPYYICIKKDAMERIERANEGYE